MSRTISAKTAREILDTLTMPGEQHVFDELVHMINSADDYILRGCEDLRYQIDSVIGKVQNVQNMNDLGEFQRRTEDIDRHITKRALAWNMMVGLLGPEKTQLLATSRLREHLRGDHEQDLLLPRDMSELSTLHQVVREQSGERATCKLFS